MKIKSRWLERLMHADKERADRRQTEDFAAYWWDGNGVRESEVRDVSTTGVFVCTSEPWAQDKRMWMTLQRRGPLETRAERRMTAQLTVARQLADGVGCMFVSVAQPEERVWEELVEHAGKVTGVHDMEGYVKAMVAVAFLRQICPEGTKVREMLRSRLSSMRLKRALEILFDAGEQVRAEADAEGLRAPQQVVERILDAGTDGEDGRLGGRWATLLARCSTADGQDESIAPVVEAMRGLMHIPLRVLEDATARARRVGLKAGPQCAQPVTCTLSDLMELTGMREIPAQQNVEQLAEIGLLEKRQRRLVFAPDGKVDVTPTALGLWTYAATSRHRGTAEEFYGLAG